MMDFNNLLRWELNFDMYDFYYKCNFEFIKVDEDLNYIF
jgi:hypothetical protein